MIPTFRFAPSPNGQLHLGHALSAITGFDAARRLSGRFLLRIEDIDTVRSRPELIEAIFEDLRWLGLVWEMPVLRQSQHFADYQAAADRLRAMGLLYPCFATRKEIATALHPGYRLDPDGTPIYPALHKRLSADEIEARQARGEPFAWRIDMAKAIEQAQEISGGGTLSFTAFGVDLRQLRMKADPARWGDAIIVRKETPASYHLACVVDDARQGVTHVTRGLDLLASTDIHVLLQVLLGLQPPLYHHHRLLTDPLGRKLAKSAGDISLASLRAEGITPEQIRKMIQTSE